MTSDWTIPDNERTGQDLLARIGELTQGVGGPGNGWRFLLLACAREIRRLNATVGAGDTAIRVLSQQIERYEKELDVMDRKQRHGCIDANCQECDQ